MNYFIEGNISASLFSELKEAIVHSEILIYIDDHLNEEISPTQGLKGLEVRSAKEIADKKELLIGSSTTDSKGNFSVKLHPMYTGSSVVIDLRMTKAPYQKSTKKEAIQVRLKKLKPIWRPVGQIALYNYYHSISFKDWYVIKSHFDSWTIYGRFKDFGHAFEKLSGYKVHAFDVDWLNDDFLGSSFTDEYGSFRIDYNSEDYKQTFLSPIIKIETPIRAIHGPGVYFQVFSPDNDLVYDEESRVGHSEKRKNIPRCYFVELELNTLSNKVVQ